MLDNNASFKMYKDFLCCTYITLVTLLIMFKNNFIMFNDNIE